MMAQLVRRALMPLVLLATLAVAGCTGSVEDLPALASNSVPPPPGSTEQAAVGREMIGKPYKAGGRWFTPEEDPDFDETGKASWYGIELHGNRTANGERFDREALTAAHPTLPLPSYVRVTNVENGKSAVLRLNDRGPFARDRLIDVSKAAAEKLGFKNDGHADVRVQYLGPAEVDGGDTETLVAEARFGLDAGAPAANKSRSIRDRIPFFARSKPAADDVEVRLAAITPDTAARSGRTPLAELPGVHLPEAYMAAPVATVASATAEGAAQTPQQQQQQRANEQMMSAADKAMAYQDRDTVSLADVMISDGTESAPVQEMALAPIAVVAPVDDVALEPSLTPLDEPVLDATPDPVAEPVAADTPAKAAPAQQPAGPGPVVGTGAARIGGAHDLFASF